MRRNLLIFGLLAAMCLAGGPAAGAAGRDALGAPVAGGPVTGTAFSGSTLTGGPAAGAAVAGNTSTGAPVAGRDPWAEVQALPSRVDGICQIYPAPSGLLTPAPKGYEAFYLSHYGRHGSRFSHRDDYYSDPRRMLEAADSADVLTPLGKSVLARLRMQYAVAKDHCGELTLVGENELKAIAERMVRNYPTVFRKGAHVDSRSTTSSRVILSMAAANERMAACCPGLRLTRSASDTYRCLGISYPMVGRDSIYRRCYEMIHKRFDLDAFARKLFRDPAYAAKVPRLDRDAWHLYFSAANLRCAGETRFDLSDILPLEDMFLFWEATNYLLYSSCSNSPFNSREVMKCAQVMLEDILARADAAVAGLAVPAPAGYPGAATLHAADLRFGHDVYLIPLAALLGLSGAYHADPYTTKDIWRYYDVSPMSGNIQLVFYAPKKALRHRARALQRIALRQDAVQRSREIGVPGGKASVSDGSAGVPGGAADILGGAAGVSGGAASVSDGEAGISGGATSVSGGAEPYTDTALPAAEVIVKVLLNEEESILQTPEGHGLPSAPTPVSGPYYRWSDLRAWLQTLSAWSFDQ